MKRYEEVESDQSEVESQKTNTQLSGVSSRPPMSLSTLNQKLSTGLAGAKRWLMLGIFLAFLASYFSGVINNYDRGIWIDCGINIILAVSLNLILVVIEI